MWQVELTLHVAGEDSYSHCVISQSLTGPFLGGTSLYPLPECLESYRERCIPVR